MSGVVRGLFGGDDGRSREALNAQLASQEASQRQSLAQSINSEAEAAQQLARGSRTRGGRRLLSYLGEEGSTLG